MALKSKTEIILTGCERCELGDNGFECYDADDMVTCFWATNIAKEPEKFNFSAHFNRIIIPTIDQKLSEHGFLGAEAYKEHMDDIYGETDSISDYSVQTDYVEITPDELRTALSEYVTDRLTDTFDDYPEYKELQNIKDEIIKGGRTNKENTILFDRAIHAHHVTGDLLDLGDDLEDFRKTFEKSIMKKGR